MLLNHLTCLLAPALLGGMRRALLLMTGVIMTASALLANNGGQVTDDDIDQIENVCRCGTYARIRKAIHRAADHMRNNGDDDDFGRSDNTPGNSGNTPAADRPNGNGNGGNGPGNGNAPDLGEILDDAPGRGNGNGRGGDSSNGAGDDTNDDSGLLGGLLGRNR